MARPLVDDVSKLEFVLQYALVLVKRLKKNTYTDEKRDARLRRKAGFKRKPRS